MNIHVVGCEASLGLNCPTKPFLFERIHALTVMEGKCMQEIEADPEYRVLKEASVECLGKDAVGACLYKESEPEVIAISSSGAHLEERLN